MPSFRSTTLLFSSIALAAVMANAAACGTADPSNENAQSGATSGNGGDMTTSGNGGATSTSGNGGGTASDCPQADSLLDVSKAPGAGASYPKPTLTGMCTDTTFVMESNNMPHYTFVQTTPNPLKEVAQHNEIPRYPKEAAATTELPLLGYLGFSVNGIPFFGPNEGPTPVDSAYGDPIYNGLMDPCEGHTADNYHYHSFAEKCLIPSSLVDKPWMNPDPAATEPSPILGWAADGFPIYGSRECADKACSSVVVMQSGYAKIGDPKKNAWDAYQWKDHAGDATYLDECNGHHGPDGDYHYHATSGFPYILGCFRGTPTVNGGMMGGPKSCTTAADCSAQGSCPQGSKGCTCANSPMGMICAPTCSTAADCPMGPNGALKCNAGVCVP